MKKTNIFPIILLLCSVGAAQSQSKKPKFDPGKLLTQVEAAAILRKPVKRAPESTGLSTAVMIQYLEDSERLMTESVSIQIHYGAGAGFARYIKALKTDLNLTPKPIQGIGAKAFWAEGQLVIQHGRHFSVVMFFSNRPDEEELKVATEVAKTFLPRVAKI